MSFRRRAIEQVITWVYTNELSASAKFYGEALDLELAVDEGSARVFCVSNESFVGVCEAWGDSKVLPEGTCLTFVTNEVDEWGEYLDG